MNWKNKIIYLSTGLVAIITYFLFEQVVVDVAGTGALHTIFPFIF